MAFQAGHFKKEPNLDLVFKEKPNNMGIYIGNVSNYNAKKGHVTLNLNDRISLGDSITFENEPTRYRVSELMLQDKNIPFACNNESVTVGRMKGNIAPGDKIFKLTSKRLSDEVKPSFSGKEFKKIKLNCKITVKENMPISVSITPNKEYDSYKNVSVNIESEIIPEHAINQPLTQEKIIAQFSKTTDTPYEFSKIDVDLDDNLYIPKISSLNALRREALEKMQSLVIKKFTRVPIEVKEKTFENKAYSKTKISLLLSQINPEFDYSTLEPVDRVYIPLRCMRNGKNRDAIKTIASKFDTYIYLPTVINLNFLNLIDILITAAISLYDIKGIVLSSFGQLDFTRNERYKNLDFVANYALNTFNDYTAYELSRNNIKTITLSPELNKHDIQKISSPVDKEIIVYGKLKVMASKYCLLGNANKCYPTCSSKCKEGNSYYLRDRMGYLFKVIPNSLQNISNIYNSKTLSIEYNDLHVDYARIDILEETVPEINNIIQTVKAGKALEGSGYTSRKSK